MIVTAIMFILYYNIMCSC